MFTGTDQSSCESRRDNMNWNTFNTAANPRLRDSQIGYWCGWIWDDI